MIGRRPLILGVPFALTARDAFALAPAAMAFPRDHGAHPQLRTEWWYVTGFASAGGREFGFQVTFFRSRVDAAQSLRSKFAAKQLLFAHAAITDVQGRKLLHDQRIARDGFDIAAASSGDMHVKIRDWSLDRQGDSFIARIPATGFELQLSFAQTQPVLLQGKDGLSRKGPQAHEASYYYSLPQLSVGGSIDEAGTRHAVAGKAWLDHEWSEEIMAPDAVGWDWIGMNLDDGSALTAFRLRRADGTPLWDGGSFRARGGSAYIFSPGETDFRAQRRWTSALSQAKYPVEWLIRTPADFYTVKALIDNQELDSRASTGAIYWEGLSDLFDSNGRKAGRGYLEMTGYAQRLRM